jgi:hypothetical protein
MLFQTGDSSSRFWSLRNQRTAEITRIVRRTKSAAGQDFFLHADLLEQTGRKLPTSSSNDYLAGRGLVRARLLVLMITSKLMIAFQA